MVGSEISPMVITLAPTMPVEAARIAPTTTTEMAMPPRRRPKSSAIVSSSSSASPDFSSATPMKTKRGTARRVKFVMVPQMRSGRMAKKSGRRTPVSTPMPPKKSPVKVRLKATGKPKKRKAIIPANMRAPRSWSKGSTSVHLVDPDRALLPAHRPEEVLHRLGEGLDDQEHESDDDHRLEDEAQWDAAGIRRTLHDAIGARHEGPRGPDDHDGRGVEEDEVEDEVHPGLPARGEPGVDDVHPHVLVVEHGVGGAHQVHHAEEMPLQLLQPHRALAEGVAQHHVEEDDQDHQEHDPGDSAAEPILSSVDSARELSQGERQEISSSGERGSNDGAFVAHGLGSVKDCGQSLTGGNPRTYNQPSHVDSSRFTHPLP